MAGSILQSDPAIIPSILDGSEHIPIVDFPSAWLMSSWMIGYVEMTDGVYVLPNGGYEIALCYLLVIDIV